MAHGQVEWAPPTAHPTTTYLLHLGLEVLLRRLRSTGSGESGVRTTEMNQVMPVRPLAVRTTRSKLSTPFLKAQIPGGERSTRVPRLKAHLLQASIPGSERSPHRRTRPLEGLQGAPSGLHALGIILR